MRILSCLCLSLPVRSIAVFFIAALLQAASPIEIKMTPATLERCHILRFPQGWKVPVIMYESVLYYGYDSKYEFRVADLLGTKFLIAGLILPEKKYTTNKYEVDLSDPKAPVLAVEDRVWDSATRIPVSQESTVKTIPTLDPEYQIQFKGKVCPKSGYYWATPSDAADRLSPDQAWLVLQSWTGSVDKGAEMHVFNWGWRYHGKVFFDVFNAETGKKVFTIEGTYSNFDQDSTLAQTFWVTERYFIVPLGEHRERCLVCEFAAHNAVP
jgi:hypothetical protein